MQRQDLVEPCDFKYLPDKTGQTAESQISPFVFQFLSDYYKGTETHAADIFEIVEIDDEPGDPLRDAGFAMAFEDNSVLRVHTASNMQHDVAPDLRTFNCHNVSRVPYGASDVNPNLFGEEILIANGARC